jgi:hypothetical protein
MSYEMGGERVAKKAPRLWDEDRGWPTRICMQVNKLGRV